MVYFGKTVFEAQKTTESWIEFLIGKARLYEKLKDKLNARQEKVLAKMFAAGPDGFTGGMSAEKYISIAKTSRPTATRDLQELVLLGAFTRTGELKSTRYWLKFGR